MTWRSNTDRILSPTSLTIYLLFHRNTLLHWRVTWMMYNLTNGSHFWYPYHVVVLYRFSNEKPTMTQVITNYCLWSSTGEPRFKLKDTVWFFRFCHTISLKFYTPEIIHLFPKQLINRKSLAGLRTSSLQCFSTSWPIFLGYSYKTDQSQVPLSSSNLVT